MNLIFENVEPKHIPLFKELTKVLNIKMRKVQVIEKKAKTKRTFE